MSSDRPFEPPTGFCGQSLQMAWCQQDEVCDGGTKNARVYDGSQTLCCPSLIISSIHNRHEKKLEVIIVSGPHGTVGRARDDDD